MCQFGELGVGRRGQGLHLLAPLAVAPGERAKAVDGGDDGGMRTRVRGEVFLVAGEEIAALAGLGFRDGEEHVVHAGEDVLARRHVCPNLRYYI